MRNGVLLSVVVLVLLVCAGLLTSCRSRWPDVSVTVLNQSGAVLESLALKDPADSDWGSEILTVPVDAGGTVTFVVLKGIYDIRALLSDSSAAYLDGVDLTGLEFFTITLAGEETP